MKVAELHGLRIGARCAGRRGRRTPPQHRLDARHELARIERLREVVVGADFEPDDAVDVVAFRGQHDDRHVFVAAAQPPADRQTVLARQHEVEDHEIVALARELPVHLGRIRHGAHAVTLLAEVAIEQIAQPRVVVDDEDFCLGFRHGRHPSELSHGLPVLCNTLLPVRDAKQTVTKNGRCAL